MKHTKHFIITCLMLCFSATLVAQYGNVAAGGDATGTGGSLSYSVGQTDYLEYGSEQATLNLGLQQVWFEFTIVVPPTLEVHDVIVAENDILCFDATETVTLAGDGTYFIVESGGSAEVIAGQNILLKYGTNIHSGADFHAWITTNGEYCNSQTSLLASFNEEVVPEKQPLGYKSMGSFFKVYPNPTTGDFTLELIDYEESSRLIVEIFTMQGNLIIRKDFPAQSLYDLSLVKHQPGIYLIRVLNGLKFETGKIIIQ
jgi:hypothetical protein